MLKHLGKRLIYTILIIAFLLVAVSGVRVSQDTDSFRRIGYFVFRPYKYGVYLGRADSYLFYNFSPYNDYIVENDGSKSHLLYYDKEILSSEFTDFLQNNTFRIPTMLLSYFRVGGLPTATFVENSKKLVYKSSVMENKVKVYISENTLVDTSRKGIIMTMSYNEDDVLFDSNGFVYSENPDSTLELIRLQTGINLQKTPSAQLPEVNQTNNLLIHSVKTNGVIKIPTQSSDFTLVNIDTFWRLLEFRVTDTYNPYIEVEVLDSLNEVK